MTNIYMMRSVLSDIFVWAAQNVRDDLTEQEWSEIRSGFSQLRICLDECSVGQIPKHLNEIVEPMFGEEG